MRLRACRLLAFGALLVAPLTSLRAWEANSRDLDAAISSGAFTGYSANIAAWLNQKVPANVSDAAVKALLKEPVFANTLDQWQLISKTGAEKLGAFAKADAAHQAFLAWLLKNTQAMDLYLEAAVPLGTAAREQNKYTLPVATLEIWKSILNADPDAKEGLYLKLAIATAIRPPGTGNRGAGMSKTPVDPVDRYKHFKAAHKNKERFPSFENLTVWEYQHVVSSCASDSDLAWAREMINTWRPDLRVNELVVNSTSEVWRRNSPHPYTDYKSVLSGGGKCGPRSSWAVMICQAFGIPAIGVGQPAHGCVAYRAANPFTEPQPGSAWKVGYGRGWHVSKLEGMAGPDFLAGVEERARGVEFSTVEHLRWLASALALPEQAAAVMGLARGIQKAAGFSNILGVRLYDCFTGGKQVNFEKNIKESWIEYTLDVPAAGIYSIELRTATPNDEQVLDISSGAQKLATVKVLNTAGLWGTTPTADIRLEKGTQTLRISAPFQRGIAVRWFGLTPKGTDK